MNLFKKVYCRIFQTGFRIAQPFLPYREPKILTKVEDIAEVIKETGLKSPLLVTDEFMKKSGATETLEKSLEESGIAYVLYDKTKPNPTVKNVEEALTLYKENLCDCLISFGGGSSMDCAKVVGARIAYPKRGMKGIRGNLKIIRKIPPLFVVPTTAGTGSEVTVTAVITDEEKKHKYTLNSFPLIPAYAVHDPKVTYTLPKHLTATTGMDALTHAVEAYIGRSTTKETRRLSKETVKLVFENIETAYSDPENYPARANMLKAAYKAGIAFSKSYVGYGHAIAHSLGGFYNTPHGLGNSIMLPIILEVYGKAIHKKLHELAVYSGIADVNDSVKNGAHKFIEKIKTLNKNMGIPEKIKGIKKEDIPLMAKYANREGNPLYPVPVLMGRKELERIYYKVGEIV